MDEVDVRGRALSRQSALSWAVDAAVAAVLFAVFWLPLLISATDPGRVAVGAGLGLVMVGALILRWRWPVGTPVVALAVTAAGWLIGVCTDPMLAVAWSLYPLASRRSSQTSVIGLTAVGSLLVVSAVTALPAATPELGERLVIGAGAVGASWLLGHVEGARVQTAERAVREQAEHERVREQAVMAREVHDVVGHTLSVISAEAGVVRGLPDADETELRESLTSIEQRSRGALEELQALVHALRSGQISEAGEGTEVPAASLPELVSAARVSGLDVEVRLDLAGASPKTSGVAMRVVQEALSNIIRHADAERCEIDVSADGSVLQVRVDDDGSGLPSNFRPGAGLTGMRERVEGLGGALTVANRVEGGARVLARIPLGETP